MTKQRNFIRKVKMENSIEETIKQLKLMLKVRKEQKEIIELGNLENYEGFNKIKVNRREDEDTGIETVDLISGKLNDVITMEVSRINPIKYERLIIEMQNLYNAKNKLLKKLFSEE